MQTIFHINNAKKYVNTYFTKDRIIITLNSLMIIKMLFYINYLDHINFLIMKYNNYHMPILLKETVH